MVARGSPREIETRTTPLPVELRRRESRAIGGYASIFGSASRDMGGFTEIVEPSAFKRTLADGGNVVCRFDHDNLMLLGTTAAGTLQLQTDSRGLDYTVSVPFAREDVLELIARQDISSSSFAFQAMDAEWRHDQGYPVRHLISLRLIDVSPVVIPAYEDSTVALRSLSIQFGADPEDVFEMSRDRQLSKLFVRTDNRGLQRGAGPRALSALAWETTHERRTRTWHQRQVELMGVKYPEDRVRPLTLRQKQTEVMRMAVPPERRSGRSALIETLALKED
jgi:uncharacterized protein